MKMANKKLFSLKDKKAKENKSFLIKGERLSFEQQ